MSTSARAFRMNLASDSLSLPNHPRYGNLPNATKSHTVNPSGAAGDCGSIVSSLATRISPPDGCPFRPAGRYRLWV